MEIIIIWFTGTCKIRWIVGFNLIVIGSYDQEYGIYLDMGPKCERNEKLIKLICFLSIKKYIIL